MQECQRIAGEKGHREEGRDDKEGQTLDGIGWREKRRESGESERGEKSERQGGRAREGEGERRRGSEVGREEEGRRWGRGKGKGGG